MNQGQKNDAATIQLVIKSVVLLALVAVASGVAMVFAGYRDGSIALLAAPGAAIAGLLGLLAKTTTTADAPQLTATATGDGGGGTVTVSTPDSRGNNNEPTTDPTSDSPDTEKSIGFRAHH